MFQSFQLAMFICYCSPFIAFRTLPEFSLSAGTSQLRLVKFILWFSGECLGILLLFLIPQTINRF